MGQRKQGSAGRAKRQITRLVQDHEIASGEPLGDLPGLSQVFLLLKRIDQFDRREEANLFAVMFDGLNAESRHQMRLSGFGASDEDDIVGIADELAPMELSHQRFVDLARGKIESGQLLVSGEARGPNLVSDRSDLSFGGSGFEQLRDDGDRCLARG